MIYLVAGGGSPKEPKEYTSTGYKLIESAMKRETLQQIPKKFGILMEYFKNQYSIKLENLKKMDEFLELAKPLKLNQEKINNPIRLITNEEIKTAIKALQLKKNPSIR